MAQDWNNGWCPLLFTSKSMGSFPTPALDLVVLTPALFITLLYFSPQYLSSSVKPHILLIVSVCCLPSPITMYIVKDKDFCLFCSLLYPLGSTIIHSRLQYLVNK